MKDMRRSQRLRALLKKDDLLMIPGAYDSITAFLIQRAGFEAVYVTGSGVSLSLLGQPDLNTVSYLELRQVVQNIVNTVSLPVVVDIDTGYGSALNIVRLIRDFETLDVAGVQIEDQAMPKKCGHEMGRKLVSADEMCCRIEAVRGTRLGDEGIVIFARTDARTTYGVDEAIARANRYLESGADVIFVESPESVDEVRKIVESVRGPILFNNVEGGRSPFLSRDTLREIGVRASIYPNALTRIITKSAGELLAELKEKGTTEGMMNRMLTHKELFALFDHDDWVELENKYTR